MVEAKTDWADEVLKVFYAKAEDLASITASFSFTFIGLIAVAFSLLASLASHPIVKDHVKWGNVDSYVAMVVVSVIWLGITFFASISMIFCPRSILILVPSLMFNVYYIIRCFQGIWNLIRQANVYDAFRKAK